MKSVDAILIHKLSESEQREQAREKRKEQERERYDFTYMRLLTFITRIRSVYYIEVGSRDRRLSNLLILLITLISASCCDYDRIWQWKHSIKL